MNSDHAPTAEEQPLELPPTRTWSGYSSEEIDAAMERICSGGKDSGIAFFTRHPHLGFATAVQTQCELTEREAQLLAALRENREMKSKLRAVSDALDEKLESNASGFYWQEVVDAKFSRIRAIVEGK